MIAVACDHGAFALKLAVLKYLDGRGLSYTDFGTDSEESCDYPVFVGKAARAVGAGACTRGIVLCSTGIGASIAANKVAGIRCALCGDPYSAEMTRRHNDSNMLAMGAGIVGESLALRIVAAWLDTPFEGGRHSRRIALIHALEQEELARHGQ